MSSHVPKRLRCPFAASSIGTEEGDGDQVEVPRLEGQNPSSATEGVMEGERPLMGTFQYVKERKEEEKEEEGQQQVQDEPGQQQTGASAQQQVALASAFGSIPGHVFLDVVVPFLFSDERAISFVGGLNRCLDRAILNPDYWKKRRH